VPTLWIDLNLSDRGATLDDAMTLRNVLEQRLVEAGASCVGGGVSLDGSSCDIEIQCFNVAAAEQLVRELLNDASLGDAVTFRSRPS
jgi:hypothetical protein